METIECKQCGRVHQISKLAMATFKNIVESEPIERIDATVNCDCGAVFTITTEAQYGKSKKSIK